MEIQPLVKEICPTASQEWVKNGALLVDVREKEEVADLAYDVTNIMHIPLSEFEERFNEIPKDKDVVLVCAVGERSLRAAGFLMNHGYQANKVVNMQHGIIRWLQKGFPTKGQSTSVVTQSGGCCGTTKNQTTQSCCNSGAYAEDVKCC